MNIHSLLIISTVYQKLEFDKSFDSKSMERKLNIKRSPYESSSNESSNEEISSQEVSEEDISEEEAFEERASEEKVPSEEVSGVHKDAKYANWVRGSWFPPPPKKDLRYDGVWHKHLFSPPSLS